MEMSKNGKHKMFSLGVFKVIYRRKNCWFLFTGDRFSRPVLIASVVAYREIGEYSVKMRLFVEHIELLWA